MKISIMTDEILCQRPDEILRLFDDTKAQVLAASQVWLKQKDPINDQKELFEKVACFQNDITFEIWISHGVSGFGFRV